MSPPIALPLLTAELDTARLASHPRVSGIKEDPPVMQHLTCSNKNYVRVSPELFDYPASKKASKQSKDSQRPLMLGHVAHRRNPQLHNCDLLNMTCANMLEVEPAYGGGEEPLTRTAKYRAVWRKVYSCRRSSHKYLLTWTNGQSLIRISRAACCR
jgi:hypothetical protein